MKYNKPTYPPQGIWDKRLTGAACDNLIPVDTIHENDWFAVRNRGGYFTLEYHMPQVMVLPVVGKRAILMVRVKRPVVNDATLELPAGGFQKGESAVDAAKRELAEETGILINDVSRFNTMPPVSVYPGRNPNLGYVFHIDVTDKEFENRKLHDDEVESVECVSFGEIKKMIAAGDIYVTTPAAIISSYIFANAL